MVNFQSVYFCGESTGLLPFFPMQAKEITHQLREAIEASGQSSYAIWKATGVSQSQLSRFRGGGTLSLDAAAALCRHLGLRLGGKLLTRRAKKA